MSKERPVRNVSAREGYDLWAETYDATENPVVAADSVHTPQFLSLRPGNLVLDAACGTGRYLPFLESSGARVVGVDFSPGMLRRAHERFPGLPLVQASLEEPLPFADSTFDSVLCALVGEHLTELERTFLELRRVSKDGARLVFSVYHPAMAESGREANFLHEEIEIRLGAVAHSPGDYELACTRGGFERVAVHEFSGDEDLARRVPLAGKFVGFPLLLVIVAHATESRNSS